MEDELLYKVVISSLILGIIIVISTLVAARPEPERFTELYFSDHQSLDQHSNSGNQKFSFTIHNLEGKDKNYNYQIKVNGQVIKNNTIFVRDTLFSNIREQIKLDIPFDKTKIEVKLHETNQEIHYWVEYSEKEWVKYDGREDGAVSCLPVNTVHKGDYLIAMLLGSPSEEWPKMEVWVNGEKERVFEVKGTWQEYVIYGPVQNDMNIDLIFVNDGALKENNIVVWDRNIFVKHLRSYTSRLNYVYDKNALDCEDLKIGALYWNGALRFKVKAV